MSELQPLPFATGAIMIAVFFTTSIGAIALSFSSSTNFQINDEYAAFERASLHKIELCLKNEKDYIYDIFLDSNSKSEPEKMLCDKCLVCKPNMGVKVEVLETGGKSWEFGAYSAPKTEEEAHSIIVNIFHESKIKLGKITLKV